MINETAAQRCRAQSCVNGTGPALRGVRNAIAFSEADARLPGDLSKCVAEPEPRARKLGFDVLPSYLRFATTSNGGRATSSRRGSARPFP